MVPLQFGPALKVFFIWSKIVIMEKGVLLAGYLLSVADVVDNLTYSTWL